jgi:intraflagellar transport protein 172
MQLRHIKTALAPGDQVARVTAVSWSPNNRRLAAATSDRVVHLFDEHGERRDKFSTKPAQANGARNYAVTALAWSPDSTKLAVAQSDCIVFVYKLGTEWGDKKSICNKFPSSSAVSTMVWPQEHHNDLIFGLADGKVKVGQLKTNKPASVYSTDSYCVSSCASPDGHSALIGHADGSVYRFTLDDGGAGPVAQQKIIHHKSTPQALSWGAAVVVAGNDGVVMFYDEGGQVLQVFDYSHLSSSLDLTCAAFSPSGEAAVVAGFNKLHIFAFSGARSMWEECNVMEIPGIYSVPSISWKKDGSRVAIGTLCGGVDIFDACMRRVRYASNAIGSDQKQFFEFTFVSASQVIVKRLSTGARTVLKSHYGLAILKINVFRDQFLVAHTTDTLLIGDLETCRLSEVQWRGSGKERFLFDNLAVCMVFNAGELSLVEYGRNELLGCARTEHVSQHFVSVRVGEAKDAAGADIKTMAYLVDPQTVRVQDLTTGVTLATSTNDANIDWLELNPRGSKLLYRDKRKHLYLYDVATQQRHTLLSFCTYVQWVPGSDVVVAQSRDQLSVWYSIDSPDRVTTFPIKGDVEDIERVKGRTDVIVDEGVNTVSYTLDEVLIDFGNSVDARDYQAAVQLLDGLEFTPESEAMWLKLGNRALQDKQYLQAERCYAALGDVCKARFLHEVNELAARCASEYGGNGYDHFLVRSKLSTLEGKFKEAENVLLEQGKTTEAMEMYQMLHRWDDAIRVADSKNHPEAETLKRGYLQWLLESQQEEKAAVLKEKSGQYAEAIQLYLKGGMPARASTVAINHRQPHDINEAIEAALTAANLHERAGEFLEKLGFMERALTAYRRGCGFRRAVDLARRCFPVEVVLLEREWAEHLVASKQLDAAANHFIEAGEYVRAIEAAIAAKQWTKAAQYVEAQDPATASKFYKVIAKHYADVRGYEQAERYYLMANSPQEVIQMYSAAGKWEKAHKIAQQHMPKDKVVRLYVSQAQALEAGGKYRDAERMYLMVDEQDLAINMYKKAKQFDHMIRLVKRFRPDLLSDTHHILAQQLESEGRLREAEKHYVESGNWKTAVQMHRAADKWEDALRVAKAHGGVAGQKQVAHAWATSLGADRGAELLSKFGHTDLAIDFAVENHQFEEAYALARAQAKGKLPDIHYKHAMHLEDEGRFQEAEVQFLNCRKPKEAIDMYTHNGDWHAAMRVAEAHDPASCDDILVAQANVALERKDYTVAEQLYLRARKPELAFKMHKEAMRWDAAARIIETMPQHRRMEFEHEYRQFFRQAGVESGGSAGFAAEARAYEQSGDFIRAIDAYLLIGTNDSSDLDALEEVWTNAVRLVVNHQPQRAIQVVTIVSQRLQQIGRPEQAADMYLGVDMTAEAVKVYADAGLIDKARSLASDDPSLVKIVETAMRERMLSGGGRGASSAAASIAPSAPSAKMGANPMEEAARLGKWDKCLEEAKKAGSEAVRQYAVLHAAALLRDHHALPACRIIAQVCARKISPSLCSERLAARAHCSTRSCRPGLEVHARGTDRRAKH